jgi:hypothetical protein
MNYKPDITRILGAAAAAFIAIGFLVGLRRNLANPEPVKPEIESVVVETNVTATIITWTKTSNGRTVTFGYVQINGKPHFLFPFTE